MENKKEKKVLGLTIIAIIVLIITVVGATYAYFVAQGEIESNANINVQNQSNIKYNISSKNRLNICK